MLLGLGLLSLPVLAHLTGYQEVHTVDFPSLRFLRASQLKVRRRTRVEALVLLILRLLAVSLLVLLFAGLSVTWTGASLAGLDPSQTTVVLLDVSASMHTRTEDGSVYEKAAEEAHRLLDGLGQETLAAVIAFDAEARVLGPGMTASKDALGAALDELTPGAGPTRLDNALRRAGELLREEGIAGANIFVLSDGTATSLPGPTTSSISPDVVVHYHDLLGGRPQNRFVDGVETQGGMKRGEGLRVEAHVVSTGTAGDEAVPLTLRLEDGLEVVGDLAFEGGTASRSFTLPIPPSGRPKAQLILPEDALPIDDRHAFTLQGESQLDVLLVSGDGGAQPRDDEVYYLEKALQPGPGSPSRIRPRVVTAEELRRIDGGRGDVVFLCNVADPRPLAENLIDFVKRGGGLFVAVGNRVDPDRYNQSLGDLLPSRFTELKTRGAGTFELSPLGLAVPPMDRDEFRVFRTGGANVFSRVRFGKVIGTEPSVQKDSEVLLRYTDGLPALLERRVGEGRVLLFTSSIDDDWTDLPLRSIFVSLMHQAARSLSGTLAMDSAGVFDVGSRVTLPVPPDPSEAAWVRAPDGRDLAMDTASADGSGMAQFAATHWPGHYALYWGTGGDRSAGILRAVFSVRVPASESRLIPVQTDALLQSVPGLVFHGAADQGGKDQPGEVLRTASLAPWLVVLLGLVLLTEGWLGGRRP